MPRPRHDGLGMMFWWCVWEGGAVLVGWFKHPAVRRLTRKGTLNYYCIHALRVLFSAKNDLRG